MRRWRRWCWWCDVWWWWPGQDQTRVRDSGCIPRNFLVTPAQSPCLICPSTISLLPNHQGWGKYTPLNFGQTNCDLVIFSCLLENENLHNLYWLAWLDKAKCSLSACLLLSLPSQSWAHRLYHYHHTWPAQYHVPMEYCTNAKEIWPWLSCDFKLYSRIWWYIKMFFGSVSYKCGIFISCSSVITVLCNLSDSHIHPHIPFSRIRNK